MSEEPHHSQRALAEKMNISLVKVNFRLAELTAKGWIKVNRFKNSQYKVGYDYLLTPGGLQEKARLIIHLRGNLRRLHGGGQNGRMVD